MNFLAVNAPPNLQRRLAATLLAVGLACLFVSLSISLLLAWRGTLTTFASSALIIPLGILLAGVYSVKRSVQLHSDIEEQLQCFAMTPSTSVLPFRPVSGDNAIAEGWNMLIQRSSSDALIDRIERKLNASLNSASESHCVELLNELPDGVALTDADAKITYANRAFRVLLGIEPNADICGQAIEELLAQAAQDDTDPLGGQASGGGHPFIGEVFRGPSPADGVLRVACQRMTEKGNQRHRLWTVRDITQQKLAEETRNQFVSTATHELRTPLTNIRAYAETLATCDDIDPEEQRRFFNTINSEATRLARFVDELLNINQMEAGALSLTCHETDCSRMIEEVIAHVQPEVQRKQMQLESRLPPKLPKLWLDKDKMTAALVNLIGNAVKYTPAGGMVRFEAEVHAREVHFHIEDTGIGIAEHDLTKLFSKFFRSEDERVREVNGSGLGLAFTQEVVRLHGGRIHVHSEINKGSRFSVTLPIQA